MDEPKLPEDPLRLFRREDLFDPGALDDEPEQSQAAADPSKTPTAPRGRELFDLLRGRAATILEALEETSDGGLSWRRVWPELATEIDRLRPVIRARTWSPELASLRSFVARSGVLLSPGVYRLGPEPDGVTRLRPQRIPREDDPVIQDETRLMAAVLVSELWPFGGRHFKPLDLNRLAWLMGALPSGAHKRGIDRGATPENVEWRGALRVLQWLGSLDQTSLKTWARGFAWSWRSLHEPPARPANGVRYTWEEFAALPAHAMIPWGTYPAPEAEELPPPSAAQAAIWKAAGRAEHAAQRQRTPVAARQAFLREYNRLLRKFERDGIIPKTPE